MYNYYNTGVTVELGELVASGFPIWDFDYPVPRSEIQYNGKTCHVDFDRERLQQKILDHYRFRQIGQETPARFKHYLKTRMLEIMPYFVQLYELDAKFQNIEDPLESYNLLETFTQETEGESATVGQGSANLDKTTRHSDTPQGSVDNLDSYLTDATQESGTSSDSSEQSTAGTGRTTHTLNRRGNIGVQPLGGEVQNIRNAFINIDMQIVENLNDLFIMVY